ncbi:MAG: hypothetical protein U9M89_00565 [Patescibacteria group bacterium]|nr:hypothetical protein [Patescibacteria group bacterium]
MEKPSKTFDRVRKQRNEEFIPPHDPMHPYKRVFEKTSMHWWWALIYKGGNAACLAILILVFFIILGVVGIWIIYELLMWFVKVLPAVVAT